MRIWLKPVLFGGAAVAAFAALTTLAPRGAQESQTPQPGPTSLYEDFAQATAGQVPRGFVTVRFPGSSRAPFGVAKLNGQNALTEHGAAAEDIVYYHSTPLASLSESYSFTYAGPQSVVDPFLVVSEDVAKLRGYVTNLTESAPRNYNAGDEVYEYIDDGTGSRDRAIRGRLRTVPYFYRAGHTYRVDVLADAGTHILTTRVYDTAVGAQAFDQSVKGLDRGVLLYPGLMNALGGQIDVHDFSFGPVDRPPMVPHIPRRAHDYLDSLGYNAGVVGPATTPQSLAFQKYFPLLGIKHVRVSPDTNSAPTLNAVASYGIDTDLLTGRTTTIASLQAFIASLRVPPDSLELWNEPNNPHEGSAYDANYATDLPIFAGALRAAFPAATIWGPSLLPEHGYPGAEQRLAGALGGLISGWNNHPYAPRMPETTGYGPFISDACGPSMKEDCGWYGAMSWSNNESAVLNPALPGVATEGAASYGSYPAICGHSNADLGSQQAYVERGMLFGFKLGYRRIYAFKFLDDQTCSDGFGKFGILSSLIQSDGSVLITPKPAYTSLVFFDGLLKDAGRAAATFDPAPLTYAIENAPPDLEELLLAQSDGTYRLVLWSDSSLWDYDANGFRLGGNPLPVVQEHVGLYFARRVSVTAYQQTPLTGAWSVAGSQASTLEVPETVTQFPMVLDIVPYQSASGATALRLPTGVPTPGPTSTPTAPLPAARMH